MGRFIEFLKYLFWTLVSENGGAVLATGIATVVALIGRMDWARKSKGFVLSVYFLQVVLNIPCVLSSDADWVTRFYAGVLMIYGAICFVKAMKIKVPKKTVLRLDEMGFPGQTVEFDDKEMFEEALKGAARGESMYICNLGLYYRNGTGTRVNLKKSKEYFEILSKASEPFWREEGRKNLEITNRMIEEKHREMGDILKDGVKDGAKDFIGWED